MERCISAFGLPCSGSTFGESGCSYIRHTRNWMLVVLIYISPNARMMARLHESEQESSVGGDKPRSILRAWRCRIQK
jgi:hypothetical protein